jgi:hypothetical protein
VSKTAVRLWSDEPSSVDLLAFAAVAETAVEAVLDDELDPVAIGISGPWGSGKSTVLKLIESEIGTGNAAQDDMQVLTVQTDPWRYDPSLGAKGTLITEVLAALQIELTRTNGLSDEVKRKLARLLKKVDWVKAIRLAAKSSITLQLPSIDSLTDLVSREVEGSEGARSLDEFKGDFSELLNDSALGHVRRVVVLVDDLDRCLPETVVDTLETMRLFLSVPKMSFVIAADEDRVADALRDRYPTSGHTASEEEPAKLYLHKIVQTTLRLPALSGFDTEAFLLLLLLQKRPGDPLTEAQFNMILASCTELRTNAEKLDTLDAPDGVDISEELQFAARLTPILYEKLHGSPRRVKRFLNDLNVRSSIADRRGIVLKLPVVAKLMILELLLPEEFKKVLGWLARGELRSKLIDLESLAGRAGLKSGIAEAEPEVDDVETLADRESETASEHRKPAKRPVETEDAPSAEAFPEELVRWAKLPPSLRETDLSPYLHLAASFAAAPLVDSALPERLRDLGANLLSSSRTAQKSVTDGDLAALPEADAVALVQHLGRMARDRPADLLSGVGGILRVAKHAGVEASAKRALRSIPAKDIKAPVVLLFSADLASTYSDELGRWSETSADPTLKTAIAAQPNSKANA